MRDVAKEITRILCNGDCDDSSEYSDDDDEFDNDSGRRHWRRQHLGWAKEEIDAALNMEETST